MTAEVQKQIAQLRQSVSQNEERLKRQADQRQVAHHNKQREKIQALLSDIGMILQDEWLHYVNNPTASNDEFTDIICLIPLGDSREVLIASVYNEFRLHAGVNGDFSWGVHKWDELKFTELFEDSFYWVNEQLERSLTPRQLIRAGLVDEHLETILANRPFVAVYSAYADAKATEALSELAIAGYRYLGQSGPDQDGTTTWTLTRISPIGSSIEKALWVVTDSADNYR